MSEGNDYEAAVAAEWGAYVASETIYLNGARAFNIGDPVPKSHVDRGVVNSEQVKKTSTKAGQELLAATAPTTEKG